MAHQLKSVPTTDESGCTLGPKTVRLDESGVRQANDRHVGTSLWAGVQGIYDDADHIFLMIDRFAGYIIPKRSFRDPGEAAEFLAFARQQTAADRGSPPG